MKKTMLLLAALAFATPVAFAQDAASAAAADAVSDLQNVPEDAPAKPKPSEFWFLDFTGNLNYGGTFLQHWAAGGDDYSHNLRALIDAHANYKKDAIFWNNRLQLDYGFLYASSKPILQKSDDRIYFESKFGYNIAKNLVLSANYDFKSQFSQGFDYKTPSGEKQDGDNYSAQQWRDARVLKSDWLAPAYTNLALGLDWTPADWFSLNFAPLTGGFVIVKDARLRKAYGMAVADEENPDYKTALENYNAYKTPESLAVLGEFYKNSRFELGAQIKMDFKVNINTTFKFASQIVAFTDYLQMNDKDKGYIRVNWDNRLDFMLNKFLTLNFITNMIYDSKVMIADKNGNEARRVQWKEGLSIGFTYTSANK